MSDSLTAQQVADAFGLRGEVSAWSLAARSANGEIWRLDCEEHFAVKRAVHEPLSGESVQRGVEYRNAAVAVGIRAPIPITSVRGRYVESIDGYSVRVSTWASGRAPEESDPGREAWLGRTLGMLHGLRYPADGFPATSHDPPESPCWSELARRAAAAGLPWAGELSAAEPDLRSIESAWVDDRGIDQIVSHRDVQPSNVVFDPASGEFTLIDWDGVGLVNPARELVSRLVTWHVHEGVVDEAGIARTMASYRDSGGTAQPTMADAFGGAPDALGYLAWQVRLSLDPELDPARHDHAVWEVQDLLREACPPGVLRQVARCAMRR